MNFFYVEIRHAEAVESKYLHVVTHLNKKQMYKITQAFVNEKYRIVIKPCEYKATCEYLGYDPFTGLDKFLEKCENVKLYKKINICMVIPTTKSIVCDFSQWYDLIEIESIHCAYDRCFVNFVSKNPLMEIKQSELLSWLHVNTGTPWAVSSLGHYYIKDTGQPVTEVKILDSKELYILKKCVDIESKEGLEII